LQPSDLHLTLIFLEFNLNNNSKINANVCAAGFWLEIKAKFFELLDPSNSKFLEVEYAERFVIIAQFEPK